MGATAPKRQYEPTGHAVHVIVPKPVVYVPAKHDVAIVAPPAANLPAGAGSVATAVAPPAE